MLPIPMAAGTVQKATVKVPWTNEVFYYGIIAVDEVGNRGQVSNIVSVFKPEITTTEAVMNQTEHGEMVFKVVDSSLSSGEDGLSDNTIIYLITAGIAAFLIILITIFFIAVCRANKRRQKGMLDGIKRPSAHDISSPITSETTRHSGIYVLEPESHVSKQPMSTTSTFASLVNGATSLPDVTLGEHKTISGTV